MWVIDTTNGSYEGDNLKAMILKMAEGIVESESAEPSIESVYFASNVNEHYISVDGINQLQKALDWALEGEREAVNDYDASETKPYSYM